VNATVIAKDDTYKSVSIMLCRT